MRQYREPTARNLLRKPLVLGVSLTGLLLLAGVVLGISVLFGTSPYGNAVAVGVGALGYVGLRILAKFSKPGWEESLVYRIEQVLAKKTASAILEIVPLSQETLSPDTLDQADELLDKLSLQERILALKTAEELVLVSSNATDGALLSEVKPTGTFVRKAGRNLDGLTARLLGDTSYVYSCNAPIKNGGRRQLKMDVQPARRRARGVHDVEVARSWAWPAPHARSSESDIR